MDEINLLKSLEKEGTAVRPITVDSDLNRKIRAVFLKRDAKTLMVLGNTLVFAIMFSIVFFLQLRLWGWIASFICSVISFVVFALLIKRLLRITNIEIIVFKDKVTKEKHWFKYDLVMTEKWGGIYSCLNQENRRVLNTFSFNDNPTVSDKIDGYFQVAVYDTASYVVGSEVYIVYLHKMGDIGEVFAISQKQIDEADKERVV